MLVRIGVILEEGAGLEIRSCLAGALAAAVFADDLATGALTVSSSDSSSRKSSSSSFFFLENFSKNFFFDVTMSVLSMGMTGDYMVAVQEGATMVRVGTGIFGARNYAL